MLARIQEQQRLIIDSKLKAVEIWRKEIDEKVQGKIIQRPDSSTITLIPKLIQKLPRRLQK
jgi:hypothetical protein